jgi:predicted transcriptional regulator
MVVTPELKKQIKILREQFGPREIARRLGLKPATVSHYTKKKKSPRQDDYLNHWRRMKIKVPQGIFNVHERENWLI